MRVQLIGEPKEYFDLLEMDISSQLCKKNELPDLIHLFVKTNKEFESQIKEIKKNLKPTTII